MNRVGAAGRGESVWLAWFLGHTAQAFGELARGRGDRPRAERCDALVARLARAVDAHGWDGEWYRRAYFDDGSPLGSHANAECRIDAIAQSWAVLAGFGDPARARRAVAASERELVRPHHGIMRLLWPPFAEHGPDPGYIRAYPPGVRENGGQYTHGVLWTVRALARLGEGDRAWRLLSLLNPVARGATREQAERYAVEPYVVAADVYDAPGFEGRGGWTWYTGSASWMYRIALEDVLGLRRHGDALELRPCIPAAWRGFEVTWRYGRSELHLTVANPLGLERGVVALQVDGRDVAGDRVPLVDDGARHEVVVTMGAEAPAEAALPERAA